MFIDTRGMSDAEKTRRRRQLLMEQMQYQSDLKKIDRRQNELLDDLRRLQREWNLLDIYIKENKEEAHQSSIKKDFLTDELRRLKKQIIELG